MKHFLSILLLSLCMQAMAQTTWYNPMNDTIPQIEGRAWNEEIGRHYYRLPAGLQDSLRTPVWNLAQQTAGMYVRFYTNATTIQVNYQVTGALSMPHMPSTGVSGVDLYMTDCNGRQTWCKGKYKFGKTVSYTFSGLTYRNIHDQGNEFCLYLPLYNGVKSLQIGVPSGSAFRFMQPSTERPIVIYGSSIAQGGCASRPGMAWTNIVQRNMDAPVVNLGFSGNGQLEEPIFHRMASTDARLFVIDCMPNMNGNRVSLIRSRLAKGVKILRQASSAPILLVEHDGYNGRYSADSELQRYIGTTRELRAVYDSLRQHVDGLHYMTTEEIGLCMDAQVDGAHPTDLGMQQYAQAYLRKIRHILPHVEDSMQIFTPCRQRREPASYEWNDRHEAVLKYVRTQKPEVVMMGNSITHYWGGLPYDKRHTGHRVWDKLFHGKKVVNMGYGWDRIENLLWRIEHGELDGYCPKKVSILIGTNNLNTDSDERIVKGIQQIVAATKAIQPHAEINVCALLPRKGMEKRIAGINAQLRTWTEANKTLTWTDATSLLTDNNGLILPELFTDGLHPNERGYEKIASVLKAFILR